MFRVHPWYKSNLHPPVFLQPNLPQNKSDCDVQDLLHLSQVLGLTKIWGADIDTVRLWCSFASWNIIRPSFKYIWFDTLETLQILQHGHGLHGGPEVIPDPSTIKHLLSTSFPISLPKATTSIPWPDTSFRTRWTAEVPCLEAEVMGQKGHCTQTFGPRKGQDFGSKIWTSEIWKLTLLSRCFQWITQVDYDDFPVPLSSIWLHGSNCFSLRPWRRHQNRLDQWRYHESSWDIRLIQGFA